MSELEWHNIDRRQLAALLGSAARVSSHAVGEATIYLLDDDGRETLAIALPGEEAVVVKRAAPAAKRRRRVDR